MAIQDRVRRKFRSLWSGNDVKPAEIVEFVEPIRSSVEAQWDAHGVFPALRALRTWTESDLSSRLSGDPWLDNMLGNKWEFATGATSLVSLPFVFSVPFVLCNARCDFCSAWLVQGDPMPIDLMDKLSDVMPFLAEISLVGWGEPLIHPQFGDILQLFRQRADSRAKITLTTNGVHLKKWIDPLLEAKVRIFGISLHAASSETHQDLMGLASGAFDKVVDAIGGLAARRSEFPDIDIQLVFIVTKQNIHEIGKFITLAERLGVQKVFFRTLRPRSAEEDKSDTLDYHRLPAYLHPEFERLAAEGQAAINEARQRGGLYVEADPETWSTPIYPPEMEAEALARPLTSRRDRRSGEHRRVPIKDSPNLPIGQRMVAYDSQVGGASDNPYDRQAPLQCPSVYTSLYINGFDRQVTPCCYMSRVPGHKPAYLRQGASFGQVWNSEAMIEVRRSLTEGPLKAACQKCPFFF